MQKCMLLALENDLGEVKTSCFFILVSIVHKVEKENCPQQ